MPLIIDNNRRSDLTGTSTEAAMERAEAYCDAGADALFVEAPQSIDEMRAICARFADRLPLLANMVEGGATPIRSAADLEAMGFSIAIFPGGIVRALASTARDYYESLARHGSNQPFAERMLDFAGLNDAVGAEALLAEGLRYQTDDD